MEYVRQSLTQGEELVHMGQFHWMYTLNAMMGIFWGLVCAIIVIVGAVYYERNFGNGHYPGDWIATVRAVHPAAKLAAFFLFIMGLLRFAQMMIIKMSTEIAITSSRLIYKRGLVARYVGEMSIDRIEGVNVLQTVMGRILGYGRIMVRGMGVGEVILPPIANPIAFRRAIERARMV